MIGNKTVPLTAGVSGQTPAGKPRLTVVMPVRNEERTLRTIVERVLSSTDLVEIELIIVDDGSTDGSRAVIRELASKHR
jgi:glycosyltransferase involved in cell wall biosynthesis